MFKFFASAALASVVSAQSMGANGYSRGVPPTTQSCNSYPKIRSGATAGAGDFNAQDKAWGLVVDREFGGCRCADEDEMEFQPHAVDYKDNTWACRCLNNDLYLSKPQGTYLCVNADGTPFTNIAALKRKTLYFKDSSRIDKSDTDDKTGCPTRAVLNDVNGQMCGVTSGCKDAAVGQQRTRWNEEAARALQTKDAAETHAKKSMMPDDEIARARILRLKMTKENRARARVQVAAISMKYRAVKNAMLAGSLDKAAFEKAYALTARTIKRYRDEFSGRQQGIEDSWNLVVKRQRDAESFLDSDMDKIESIYEQTLASLADRYGKRIAYYQSLPTVLALDRLDGDTNVKPQTRKNCPIFEE